jgi:O-antigen/teichoic acid export membrane protein
MTAEPVATMAAPEPARAQRLVAHLRSPLHRNGYALVLSTFSTSGLGALYWALAARRFSLHEVGIGGSLIASMQLLTNLSSLNFTDVLNRFVPVSGRSTKRLVLLSYGIAVGLGLVSAAVFLAGIGLWTPRLRETIHGPALFAVYVVSVLLWIVFVLQDAVLIGVRRASYVLVENSGYGVMKIVLLFMFASMIPKSAIFLSWTAPLLIVVPAVSLVLFRNLVPRHVERTRDIAEPITRSIIGRFLVVDYLSSMLWTAAIALTPIIVLAISGASASGYVYIAWTIAYTLVLVSRNMGMSLTTEGAHEPERLWEHTRATLKASFRIIAPLAALLVVGAPLVLAVFGTKYQAGAGVLRLFALSTIPAMIPLTFVTVARVQKRLTAMLVVTALTTVPVLVLAPILMHIMGVIGMGYAWLIVQSAGAIFLLLGEMRPHLRAAPLAVS